MKKTKPIHPDHRAEITRLARAIGQLEGIRKMIEEGRYCADILIQLRAVHSAVRGVEAAILEKHLESCVREAFESRDTGTMRRKIVELTRLYKRAEDPA